VFHSYESDKRAMMKIAFVYTGIAGYMTDCWRALGSLPDVELRVWLEDMKEYRFNGNREEALRGIDVKWEYSENISTTWLKGVESEIESFAPNVLFVCGWSRRLPPFVANSNKLKDIPMVLDFDMPWEWKFRKIAAKFIMRRKLHRYSAAFVPGETTATYARWLGFQDKQIFKGRNCIDVDKFKSPYGERVGFLFLGRHVKEKGLDVLKNAYELYRLKGGNWKLTIPEYVEPMDVPAVMHKHSCLVLPSKWEPWGVVVLEALAAGMKTIVSDRVGARFDLPVDEVFKSGDSVGLAEAMLRIEKSEKLDGNIDLSNYSTSSWTHRVFEICERCRK